MRRLCKVLVGIVQCSSFWEKRPRKPACERAFPPRPCCISRAHAMSRPRGGGSLHLKNLHRLIDVTIRCASGILLGSGWASLGTHASTLGKSRGGHPCSVRWQLRARGFASVVRSAEDLQGAPCTNLFTRCDEGWVAGHRAHAHRMRLFGDVQCPRP